MIIGTHHGKFHADEVLAVAILRQLEPDASIVRSRDPETLSTCDIVVDVNRSPYDHHTTDKQYRTNGIPFASAGLVWRDFGVSVITAMGADEATGITLRDLIDEKVIQAIDAIDNGVDLERDARIKGISEVIGTFNPPWNSDGDENEAFERAVRFASEILQNYIRSEWSRLEAIDVVKSAFERRPRPELLVLERFCPWTETLLEIDTSQQVLYVVFPDKTGQYRLQVVPKNPGTFVARKPLPARWAGLDGPEFAAASGTPDGIFCHPARFIAGAGSLQGILQLAEQAIQEPVEN
ncbi:MYG1 family protein [Alicyclobacillus acidiphilus]|uniref:MYG1 family protein n=1 Tax=Alicyclobacillus acidiphilus TaxID=182455 RepID=UPI0008353EAE|nr:MYG1 family protein [Alicyclobacillus acidiphilus]